MARRSALVVWKGERSIMQAIADAFKHLRGRCRYQDRLATDSVEFFDSAPFLDDLKDEVAHDGSAGKPRKLASAAVAPVAWVGEVWYRVLRSRTGDLPNSGREPSATSQFLCGRSEFQRRG